MRLLLNLFRRARSAPRPAASVDPGVQYRPVARAFGLDISAAAVKVVELSRRRGEYVVEAFNSLELPAGAVDHGEVQNVGVLLDAIRAVLATARPRPITGRYALLSFPENQVYLHPFEYPTALSESQVRRAVLYEAEGELPITVSEMYTDTLFHQSRAGAHHVLFAAAPRRLVDTYLQVLLKAGLRPVAVEAEALALARCLISLKADPLLLLDIGVASSTITTLERGLVHGAVNIPVGGATLTRLLADVLGVGIDKAEQVKREQGLEGIPKAAQQNLEATLQLFVEEARKAASYHETHTGRPVREMVLSGGSARLKGLLPFFQKRLDFSISLGDPGGQHTLQYPAGFPAHLKSEFATDVLVYANCLGLALRGASPDPVRGGVNLLPKEIKKRYERWREHLLLAVASIGITAVVTGSAVSFGFWAMRLSFERRVVAREAALLREALADERVRAAVAEAEHINRELKMLQEFEARRRNLGGLLADLVVKVPPSITLSALQVTPSAGGAAAVDVRLDGMAARREDYLAFENVLRSHAGVTRLDSPLKNLERPVEAPFQVTVTVSLAEPSPAPGRETP